jgi:uncharacterized cupin superfamily protein
MVPEAKLEAGVPQSEGWFVLNARDARWQHNELGAYCGFEGQRGKSAGFEELGINLNVLPPGKPMAMYHGEPGEEAFLVLDGECILIAEGEERPLRKWDFVFCPPWTEHVIVGAGTRPALVLAAGVRKEGIVYPVNEMALEHGAGVERETRKAAEAYSPLWKLHDGPAPELD